MEHKLLLPHRYKRIGIILLIPSLILGILVHFFDFQFSFLSLKDHDFNFTDELALTGIIISLLFIAFAREKTEDEFIAHVRLASLKWAVLINYVLLLLATWLVYGFAYVDVMMYNMLTILIIFIIRFHFVLRSGKKITG